MELIVSGIFKCGSTTLYNSLKNGDISNEYNIKKEHISYNLTKNKAIYFIPIRNQKETYFSGFFQDIHVPIYEYSVFHDEENIKVWKSNGDFNFFKEKYKNEFMGKIDLLYNTFKKINFEKYHHLNNKSIIGNFPLLAKIPFKKNSYHIHQYDENIILCFIDFKIIGNINIINNILNELNISIKLETMTVSNQSKDKFIHSDYIELKNILNLENYFDNEYYDFLNDDLYDII